MVRGFVWEKVAGWQANATDHKLGSSTYFFPALFICGIHKVPGPGPAKGLMLRATSCEK